MKQLSEFDFHHTLARTEGPVLVMFSSPTCGTCRALEKRLPEFARGLVSGIFKVDVQRSTGLAHAYEVFHLPALFLFADGKYHAPINCEATPRQLRQAIETALALPAEEEP